MKSEVRIIGGQWRGRKIPVLDAEGLRSTPDRIRETLFNWLGFECRNANVLDCFAGSGVLGFEALSRGARHLVSVEQEPRSVRALRQVKEKLDSEQIEIIESDVLKAIALLDCRFDIVFIDPPYAHPGLRAQAFELLAQQDALNDGASCYFEWPAGENFELPSQGLSWSKQKKAGQVNYAIAKWKI